MPRKYQPDPTKKRYKKYDKTILCQAVEELNLPGATLKHVAEKYNIHMSVLYRHSKRVMKPQGGQTALTEADEEYLVSSINTCGEWGYPLDTMDLRYIVKMYLDKLGIQHKRFRNNFPGPDFVEGFLRRHSGKITKRVCQNIKRSRAAVSPDTIKDYYSELQKSLDGVPPTHILNYDETNLCDDPGQKKVLMKRGTKYPERVLNSSKASTSLMIAGTAAGSLLPPYVVYKAQHLYDSWVKNGPKDARYNRSSSGWFDGKIFEDWVTTVVIPYFDKLEGRKVMIGDNLSSHLSAHLIKTCKEKNIDFVFLPANSTHLTQPLDVAFFRPMKQAWRTLLLKWKKTDGRSLATVPKGCFPKLLKLLIEELTPNSENNLKAGFKKCGIHPLNVDEILSRLPHYGQDAEANSEAINESILTLLKEMRYGSMNITEPTRKRKLNVVAGQSVATEDTEGLEDISNTCEPSTSSENGKKKKTKKVEKDKAKKAKTVTPKDAEDLEELPYAAETKELLTLKGKRKNKKSDKEDTTNHMELGDECDGTKINLRETVDDGTGTEQEKEDIDTPKKVIIEILDRNGQKSKGLKDECEAGQIFATEITECLEDMSITCEPSTSSENGKKKETKTIEKDKAKKAKTVTLKDAEDLEELPDAAETKELLTLKGKGKNKKSDKEDTINHMELGDECDGTEINLRETVDDGTGTEQKKEYIDTPKKVIIEIIGRNRQKSKGLKDECEGTEIILCETADDGTGTDTGREKEHKDTLKKVIVEIIDENGQKSKGTKEGCEGTKTKLCETIGDSVGAMEDATHDGEITNSLSLTKNILREDEELNSDVPIDIESMPVVFFDDSTVQEVIIDDSPSNDFNKNKINVSKIEIVTEKNIKQMEKGIKVESNLRLVRKKREEGKNAGVKTDNSLNLQPVSLKEKLKIPLRVPPASECKQIHSQKNIVETEKQSTRAHRPKNYYNKSEEIFKVLSENEN